MLSQVLSIVVLVTAIRDGWGQEYRANSLSPTRGSMNGATMVSIFGHYNINPFSASPGKTDNDTRVFFRGARKEYECDVEKDSTHETQITCYTRPMPDGHYYVCPELAGERLNCLPGFWVNDWWNTPLIRELWFNDQPDNFAGFPRSIITIKGRIFTDIYGPNDENSLIEGNDHFIRSAYAGALPCGWLVEGKNDELYGLEYDPPTQDREGVFTCIMTSQYVGNNNFSAIHAPFGRFLPQDNLMRVAANDQLYMFQTYAEITGVSPQSGSKMGGTLITITGKFFDPSPRVPTKLYVGGQPCDVIEGSVTDSEIKCITPAETEVATFYPGSRGVFVEMSLG